MMGMPIWLWLVAGLGAFLVGLGKGGLPGVGNFTVLLFVYAFEAKASVGLLLPILISADVVAITVYRRSVAWVEVLRLLPWMALGVVGGYLVFDQLEGRDVARVIGFVVLSMTCLQLARRWLQGRDSRWSALLTPESRPYAISLGLIGGMATMLANAAGPVGQLYFLSARLPKLFFIGTSAWVFFLINVFKLPFQASLGILSLDSLAVSGSLMPFAVVGALTAPSLVRWINEVWFARLIWCFIIVAAIKLLLF